MSDQDQGNTTVTEEEVGKTKIQLDEYFGMKRHDVPLGHIIRTPEENDAMYTELVGEVARRAEANRAGESADAKWIKDRLPSDYLEKLGKSLADVQQVVDEERAFRNQRRVETEERLMAATESRALDQPDSEEDAEKCIDKTRPVQRKSVDEKSKAYIDKHGERKQRLQAEKRSKGEDCVGSPTMDELVDAVMTEIAKRLLPETFEVRDTVNERTAAEFGDQVRKAAKALWTELAVEREEEKIANPRSRRHHQAVTSTLAIPVEEEGGE